ncbi:MAG: 3-phosphoshikimate 1-carboxyvinyltransferase [Gemmatimonadota bacterium]
MSRVRLEPLGTVRVRLTVPGDKSIAHRALLLGALGEGVSAVRGVPGGQDVASTAAALAALGVRVDRGGADGEVRVTGGGAWRAAAALDCGNSGTTARLLLGVLAPRAAAPVTLTGDDSLRRRPMGRVVTPLTAMGAAIEGSAEGNRLPLTVKGRPLRGALHRLPVASAQVKSALLLAGLAAAGETVVVEPGASRDHTERLLAAMGADLSVEPGRVAVRAGPLAPFQLTIPGDFSSAAPLLAMAAARPGSEVTVDHVGLNPTRTGFLDILRAFGAEVETRLDEESPEPRGTVRVTGRALTGIAVDRALVPRAIDELPLVAVLGTQARGETRVSGAAELRVKESDRIAAMVEGLRRLGAAIDPTPDGFLVAGPSPLTGAVLDAAGDHRIGMALAVAAALAPEPSTLTGAEWVDVSFPDFFRALATCGAA